MHEIYQLVDNAAPELMPSFALPWACNKSGCLAFPQAHSPVPPSACCPLSLPPQEMELAAAFNVALHVPLLNQVEQKSVLSQLGAFSGPEVRRGCLKAACRPARHCYMVPERLKSTGGRLAAAYPFCCCAVTCPQQANGAHFVLRPSTPFLSRQLDAAVAELPDADVPIKRLLLLLDLARQGQPAEQPQTSLTRWAQVLRDLAVS